MLRDVRLAVRSLFRDPGFTAVVVATLALGIGANTSIFSVVDAVLLEELPYPEPDRLVTVWQDVSRRGGPVREWLNMAAYRDVRDEPGLFESVGVWGTWFPTLTGVNEPVVLQGAEVSHEMFPGVLRVRAELGRAFLAEDDVQGAAGVVVLSHAAWHARFGGDPATQVVVRVPGGAASAAPALRGAILAADPTLSMTPVISLARASGLGVLPQRVAAGITSVLGALALLLSALGVPSSLALGFVLRSFLLGLSPFDPVVLLTVPAALLAAVVVASAMPARRAAGAHPAEALRSE